MPSQGAHNNNGKLPPNNVGGAGFVTFWSLAGQTPGMRFLSIRVVHDGSSELGLRRAIRRVLGVLLSLLPAGLGFFAILRDPQRRAWHDRLAKTEVIYDMAARSAPHAGDRQRPAARGAG